MLAKNADDRERKYFYEWQLPFLENEFNPAELNEHIISSLIGNFEGGRKVISEDNQVYYINSIGEKEKLDYIGNGVFQNSLKKYLRLVMPFTDKPVPYFDWTWDDGGENQRLKRIVNE